MRILKKGDPEYIDNGHYRSEGEEFMSIWAYKCYKNMGNNSNDQNGFDAGDMNARGYLSGECVPDFGNFDKVFIFTISDLDEYYSKK